MKHHRAEIFDGDLCLICPGKVPFKDSDGWNDNTCPHSIAQNEKRAFENRVRRIARQEAHRKSHR